jgi:hypothetical protein
MARRTRAATSDESGRAESGNGGGAEENGKTAPAGVIEGSGSARKGRDGKAAGQMDPAVAGDSQERAEEGGREVIRPANVDRVYTASSKEVWGADQPSLSDQLAAQRKTEEEQAEKADK